MGIYEASWAPDIMLLNNMHDREIVPDLSCQRWS